MNKPLPTKLTRRFPLFLAMAAASCAAPGLPDTSSSSSTSVTDGDVVRIVSVASGKVLDIAGASPADGALVQQWSYAAGANQQWRLHRGTSGTYTIVSIASGACLDVAGASQDDGARLQQWSCAGQDNQRWDLRPAADGSVDIVSVASGKCVDLAGASADDGAFVQQWSCAGAANQRWRIETLTSPPPASGEQASLRSAAAGAGKWMGVALSAAYFGDTHYREVAGAEFDYATPENEMKWDATEPAPGQFTFEGGDAVVGFAAQHGMRVKGHTLVWHNQLPTWVSALPDPEAVRAAMNNHVTALVSHYRGKVAAWDVVNEAIDDAPAHLIRDDVFHHALGDGYIADAFRLAHQIDPDALLFYNDYGIEGLGGKADAMYALVKGLVEAGVPISGVGLQTHVRLGNDPSAAEIAANMHRIAALGLLVNVSELDVNVCGGAGTTEQRLAAQSTRAHDIVAACMSEPRCPSITLWGVADSQSWLNAAAPCAADQPGQPWGLAFDDTYARKPAWRGIVDALTGR